MPTIKFLEIHYRSCVVEIVVLVATWPALLLPLLLLLIATANAASRIIGLCEVLNELKW